MGRKTTNLPWGPDDKVILFGVFPSPTREELVSEETGASISISVSQRSQGLYSPGVEPSSAPTYDYVTHTDTNGHSLPKFTHNTSAQSHAHH